MTLKLVHASRDAFSKLKRKQLDEDCTMRLFSRFTITFLAISALLVTPRQFMFSAPIKCWSSLSGATTMFLERMCLINGTYILPKGEFAVSYQPSKDEYIHWYAITPLLLIAQTVAFACPRLLWAALNHNGGIEVSEAIKQARISQMASKFRNTGVRREEVQSIVNNISQVDMKKKKYPKLTRGQRVSMAARCRCCTSSFSSLYLTNLLIIVKALYIISIPVNVAFISGFLGRGYFTMGFEIFSRFSLQKSIYFENMFPMSTLCKIVAYANTIEQPQVVQCMLLMNMYNEKLFLILWYWYLALFIIAIIDFIQVLVFRFMPSYRLRYFRAELPVIKNQFDGKSVRNFFNHHCSVDCCFALKLMKAHLDHVTMKLILEGLITDYMAEESKMRINEGFVDDDDVDEYGSSNEDVDAAINKQEMEQVANMKLDD